MNIDFSQKDDDSIMRIAPAPPIKFGEQTTVTGRIRLPGYCSDTLKIFMFATYDQTEYTFMLDFDKPKLYRRVRKFVFNNRNNSILVFGTWYPEGNRKYSAKITDELQVTAM